MKSPLIIPAAGPLEAAVAAIKSGGIVAYPTETFYGLGCDPFSPRAVKRLFDLKGREEGKPVSVIIPDAASLAELASEIPSKAKGLIDEFWPGPLTLIFKASARVPREITGGTGKVGVRVSSSPYARRFIASAGGPVTATSANPSGKRPSSTPAEVIEYFDARIDALIDGGALTAALPSTVVDVTGPEVVIIREGAILSKDIMGKR